MAGAAAGRPAPFGRVRAGGGRGPGLWPSACRLCRLLCRPRLPRPARRLSGTGAEPGAVERGNGQHRGCRSLALSRRDGRDLARGDAGDRWRRAAVRGRRGAGAAVRDHAGDRGGGDAGECCHALRHGPGAPRLPDALPALPGGRRPDRRPGRAPGHRRARAGRTEPQGRRIPGPVRGLAASWRQRQRSARCSGCCTICAPRCSTSRAWSWSAPPCSGWSPRARRLWTAGRCGPSRRPPTPVRRSSGRNSHQVDWRAIAAASPTLAMLVVFLARHPADRRRQPGAGAGAASRAEPDPADLRHRQRRGGGDRRLHLGDEHLRHDHGAAIRCGLPTGRGHVRPGLRSASGSPARSCSPGSRPSWSVA